jgi:MSHA pilin protein MshC
MTDMRIKNDKGFTFIELIMVLVVAAIIGVIALNRLMSTGTELIAVTDTLKTHLRYAQARAMSSDVIWGIHCDGDFYWLFYEGDINNKKVLLGEDSDTVKLYYKSVSFMYVFTLEPIDSDAFTISFDDRGVPHTDASAADGNELAAGHSYSQITVTSGGGDNQTITITPNTGFIP